jgi:hypothetical protein
MKFEKLEIELSKNYATKKDELKGKIRFQGEQIGDWLSLALDEEWCKKMLEVSLPLIEKATNEHIEFIRKEVGLEKEEER